MEQGQRLEYLLKYLMNEAQAYQHMEMPTDTGKQRYLLRALLNVRPPNPISQDFISVQDQYLREEAAHLFITDGDAIPSVPGNAALSLWQGDITTIRVDAIVNAANSGMLGCFVPCHSCIDNVIHTHAGIQLRLACEALMAQQGHEEPTGSAKITQGYNLPCKHVIHTVGPIVSAEVTQHQEAQLASCYRACLDLAVKHSLQSIAFCCISTGEFHFPKERAAEIAVETVTAYLKKHTIKVIFNVFTQSDQTIYSRLLGISK